MSKLGLVLTVFLTALSLNVSAKTKAAAKTRLPANANSLKLECGPPENFAGVSAKVSGTLKLKKATSGAFAGKGKLKIELLSARDGAWSGTLDVTGQYDDLTDQYFNGAADVGDELMIVYVNFTRPETSHIEFKDKTYLMTCR